MVCGNIFKALSITNRKSWNFERMFIPLYVSCVMCHTWNRSCDHPMHPMAQTNKQTNRQTDITTLWLNGPSENIRKYEAIIKLGLNERQSKKYYSCHSGLFVSIFECWLCKEFCNSKKKWHFFYFSQGNEDIF